MTDFWRWRKKKHKSSQIIYKCCLPKAERITSSVHWGKKIPLYFRRQGNKVGEKQPVNFIFVKSGQWNVKRYAWNNFIGNTIIVAKFCLRTKKKVKIFHSRRVWGLTSLSRSKSLHLNQIHMHDRCRTLDHRSTCKNVHLKMWTFSYLWNVLLQKKADLSHLKGDKKTKGFLVESSVGSG